MGFALLCIMSRLLISTILFCGIFQSNYVHTATPGLYDLVVKDFKYDYVKDAMPVCKAGEKLNVEIDMWLYQLFDLDEPTQMLTIDVWMEMIWKDCRIKWDKSKFSNIDEFSIRAEEIWYPDLIYYESLHGNFEEGMFIFGPSTARVRNDGMMQLGAQVLLKAFCRVHIETFPFDSQVCNITFASWTKDDRFMHLKARSAQHGGKGNSPGHAFKDASNGEWEVLGFPSSDRISKFRMGFDENVTRDYSEVVFTLTLKRKPLYLKIYMIFPCMMLTWLGLMVFFIPIESGEKISFSITILLSLIVFLLLVADNIPRSSDGVPVLGVFFVMSIVNVSLALIMTCFVLNIGLKSKDICMPRWLHHILVHASRFVLFRYDRHQVGQAKWLSFKLKKRGRPANSSVDTKPSSDEQRLAAAAEGDTSEATNNEPHSDVTGSSVAPPVLSEWRYLATVLDRLFLIIYCIINLISTLYLLCSA